MLECSSASKQRREPTLAETWDQRTLAKPVDVPSPESTPPAKELTSDEHGGAGDEDLQPVGEDDSTSPEDSQTGNK